MADSTEISWADSTFNPWIGCTKVSPGCDHCYAERDMAIRRGMVQWGPGALRRRTSAAYWKHPLTWDRKARESGKPWRVFCASLADVFDNEVDGLWRVDLFSLIAQTPHLTWLLLTKRIGNVTFPMPHNVWLGITVVNQAEAERDIPKLLRVPATKRWLSCEPLLGPLELEPFFDRGATADNGMREYEAVDWVIVGGESGPRARPIDADWVRDIRDQCDRHRVAFHFKQWGGLRPKDGGHALDGRVYRAFPLERSINAE